MVEHQLPKLRVAGSIPVSRSITCKNFRCKHEEGLLFLKIRFDNCHRINVSPIVNSLFKSEAFCENMMNRYFFILSFSTFLMINISFGQYYQLTPKVGGINWTDQVVRATGLGSPNPNMPPGSRRAGAIEAAKVTARKNMLQVVKGMNVDSKKTIENLMSEDDKLQTKINGIVRDFRIIDTRYMQAGAIEVDVEVPLSSFYEILPNDFEQPQASQQQTRQQKQSQQYQQQQLTQNNLMQNSLVPSDPSGNLGTVNLSGNNSNFDTSTNTGLIVDTRGLFARPALAPKIINESGLEVYGATFVSPGFRAESGIVLYENNINQARENTRISDKPLVIKAIRVSGSNKTDIVIKNADADLIQKTAANFNYLEQGNVIIVLD